MNLTLHSIYPTLIPLAHRLAQRLPGPATALFLARLLIPLAILVGFILPQVLPAAPASSPGADADRTLSPYFGSVLKVQQKVGSWKGGFGDQT